MILLNPGPVNLSERVRAAMVSPDLCHREPEFSQLQSTIRKRLLEVYGLTSEAWAPVLFSGSGTAAVEAMISSLVPDASKLLIIENGVYGERMTRMAETHGIAHDTLHHGWGEEIDAPALEIRLASGDISHVAVVHHETTTGRLNDLGKIGSVCRDAGAELLVDAVSSFGAEQLDFRYITACAATANKCLHGAPGASFVLTRRGVLESAQPRCVYLDLVRSCQSQDSGSTSFTPAIPCFHALAEALAEHAEQGGVTARRKQYEALAEQTRKGLEQLGVVPWHDNHASSCVLRAYALPRKITYKALHAGLKERGFIIYAGQGGLSEQLFRISTMGAITEEDMQDLVKAFSEALCGA